MKLFFYIKEQRPTEKKGKNLLGKKFFIFVSYLFFNIYLYNYKQGFVYFCAHLFHRRDANETNYTLSTRAVHSSFR